MDVVVSSLAITSGPHTSLLCLISPHFSASVWTQSHHLVSLHALPNIHARAVSLASELFCPITLLMPSCSFACVQILVGIEWLWLTGWPRFFIFYRPLWAMLQDVTWTQWTLPHLLWSLVSQGHHESRENQVRPSEPFQTLGLKSHCGERKRLSQTTCLLEPEGVKLWSLGSSFL